VGDPGVIIGYGFWGFLGNGITDTPDGGRAHRRTLIDGLAAHGHQLVFLHANRDLDEAGDDLTGQYTWHLGYPDIDVLFLEWRWTIPGRNDTPCGSPGHTCDLHRQTDLLDHYTLAHGMPTVVWDKDQQLSADNPLRLLSHVTVCEPALHPRPGATRLLFPVADTDLDAADPAALATAVRDLPLVYVGNQYDRDNAFDTYFAPPAAHHRHLVAGKWPRTERWPHVRFAGRVPFTEVRRLHQCALSTVLLLPFRYAAVGQFTQRTFEAVLAGCLPITPAAIRSAPTVVPPDLLVRDGTDVTAAITRVSRMAGTAAHAQLIGQCLRCLEPFRQSHQIDVLDAVLDRAVCRRPAPLPGG
jgi:hypothetical protein